MDTSFHTMNSLFSQLGLPDDDASIEKFVRQHQGLDKKVHLDKAPFWTPAQAKFIEEAFQDDSDWTEMVDHLDALLRH
ncbi:DUF2789 domain-containing protein [Alkalimarinus alittae]|uniref:DUF2789 domain-containing protein n=1 Tax=Alkalimarinus alittae TaxID=2961619 RepID=A0ABY6N2H5_9ALTE|nr:DUF2789 domain-containing protein [Alkalimarinus alittae]UZE96212.1 DUF2789 domain-containing protein [Alkalimarinus alittae]